MGRTQGGITSKVHESNAIRYDKCPANYLAAIKLICARIGCAT